MRTLLMGSRNRSAPLAGDEVHIWQADLRRMSADGDLLSCLSAEEDIRASKFRFERDRSEFVLSRATLRHILSRYLKTPPAGIALAYTATGKPILRDDHRLWFSVSHSNGLALFAISRMEVGIDVEHVCAFAGDRKVAAQFFSSREVSQLAKLPAHLWPSAFFRCWTEKEAVLKAVGSGLSVPTQSFEVPLLPGDPHLVRISERGWTVGPVSCPPHYAAACAANSENYRMKLFHLS